MKYKGLYNNAIRATTIQKRDIDYIVTTADRDTLKMIVAIEAAKLRKAIDNGVKLHADDLKPIGRALAVFNVAAGDSETYSVSYDKVIDLGEHYTLPAIVISCTLAEYFSAYNYCLVSMVLLWRKESKMASVTES